MDNLTLPGPLSDPTGARLAAVMVKYAAPDDVLAAEPGDLFSAPKLPCNFADRQFTYPVHTKAAAWVSAAWYHNTGIETPEIADRIKQAFVYHRLSEGEWSRLKKTASPNPGIPASIKYAFPESKKYPINTPEQIKAAAEYFIKYADRMTQESRQMFAGNVIKAAADNPGLLPDDTVWRLEVEAGWARKASGWQKAFDTRIGLAGNNKDLVTTLTKVAADASAVPTGTFKDAAGLARLLRSVDKVMGWDLPDPLTQLAGDTPSTAYKKLAGTVESVTGDWYNTTDFDAVPAGQVNDLFGTGPVVSRATKAALACDPIRGTAFLKLAASCGVRPVSVARKTKVDWAAEASRKADG